MKRFHFSLERVRQWRHVKLETEEAKLEQLIAAKQALLQQGEMLMERLVEAENAVWDGRSTDALQLRALDDFRQYIASENARLQRKIADAEHSIQKQRECVVEERRSARLLDRMRDRRHTEWEKDFDRELEALAAESYLARWVRVNGNAKGAANRPLQGF
jgi:hypothetical protein